MKLYIEDLKARRKAAQADANEHQRAHDLAQRLVDRSLVAGRKEKAAGKIEKRDEHGQKAKAARALRDTFDPMISDAEQQLAWLIPVMAAIEQGTQYYELRHELMLARRQQERGNPDALELKLRYMRYARIPKDISPDDVLYYRIDRTVHLFYGGEKDFYGPGTSPDGVDHAHIMLALNKQNRYYVKFSRLPGE